MSSVGKLSGRVALVTGGASPVGAAVARRLADDGAAVLIADVRDRRGQRLAEELREAGSRAAYIHLDVTSQEEWRAALAATVCEFDGLDILVNCTGPAPSGPIAQLDLARWNQVIAASQTGVFLGLKAALNVLAVSEHGSVINIGPPVASLDGAGSPLAHTVGGAISGLSKSIAAHWAPLGIRVNAICPGPTDCEDPSDESPADIAACVAFLASDDSAFLTGLDLRVDGGLQADYDPPLMVPARRPQ